MPKKLRTLEDLEHIANAYNTAMAQALRKAIREARLYGGHTWEDNQHLAQCD